MGTSPPLIIGFIAIGTFALGVIALCAWRRITGRDLALGARDGGGNGVGGGWGEGGKVVLGKRPELFEVWWDEEGDEKGYGRYGGGERPVSEVSEKGKRVSFAAREDLSWQSLMPISAAIVTDPTPPPPPPSPPPSPKNPFFRGHLRSFSNTSRAMPAIMTNTDAQTSQGESDSSSSRLAKSDSQNASLQVAVVLAMPSERRSSARKRRSVVSSASSSLDADSGDGEKNVGQAQSPSEESEWALEGREYTIGLLEIPWTSREQGGGQECSEDVRAGGAVGSNSRNRTYRARSASGLVYC